MPPFVFQHRSPMNAGFRPPSSLLALAFLMSIALHVAVLLDIDWQPARHSTRTSIVAARLVPAEGEASEWSRTRAREAAATTPHSPRRVAPVQPSLASAPQKDAETAPPRSRVAERDLPMDLRIREVVVTSPSIYGLPEKHPFEGGELPYAWSDDLDLPPQATSMSRSRFPLGTHRDSLVLVRAVVGTTGSIGKFEILCGAPPFDEVARKSLPQWEFVPPTARGRPARAWLLLEFAFLRGNTEEGFDPSLADVALNSLREKCAESLTAQRR